MDKAKHQGKYEVANILSKMQILFLKMESLLFYPKLKDQTQCSQPDFD